MDILAILEKVGFDWKLAVLNLINFLIIFVLLKKFLFKPVAKKLDERQQMIRDGVDNAKKAETELMMSRQKSQEMIDHAKVEANKIMEKSHDEAVLYGESLRKKATAEIEALIQKAKGHIQKEKEEMREELRHETVELVLLATEKILGKELKDKKSEEFIKDILSSVKLS